MERRRVHRRDSAAASFEGRASTSFGTSPANTTQPPAARKRSSSATVVRRIVCMGGTRTARYSARPTFKHTPPAR